MGGINFVVHDSTNVVELFKAMNGMDMSALNPNQLRPRRSAENSFELPLQLLTVALFLTLAIFGIIRKKKSPSQSARNNRTETVYST